MFKTKQKSFIFGLILTVSFFSVAGTVFAEYGLEETAGAAGLTGYGSNLPQLVGNVIGTALSMIAVLFFLLTVYGGFLWMTAHGKEDQVKKAQDTLIAATIGIVVVLASYALTSFVFQSVGGGGGGGEDQERQWCITAEYSCVLGGGGPCSGQILSGADQVDCEEQACISCCDDKTNSESSFNFCVDGVFGGLSEEIGNACEPACS